MTFCGHCRTDDALSRFQYRIKKGEIVLPTLAQYTEAVAQYMERYNNTVQEGLGCSPAQLWKGLERYPVNYDLESLYRNPVSSAGAAMGDSY